MATVVLFGKAREVAGVARDEIDGPTVHDVVVSAGKKYGAPFVDVLSHCSIMLDGEHIRDYSSDVNEKSEVAILPPVSGG